MIFLFCGLGRLPIKEVMWWPAFSSGEDHSPRGSSSIKNELSLECCSQPHFTDGKGDMLVRIISVLAAVFLKARYCFK